MPLADRLGAIKRIFLDKQVKFFQLPSLSSAQIKKYIDELEYNRQKLEDCSINGEYSQETFLQMRLIQLLGERITDMIANLRELPEIGIFRTVEG